MRFAYIDSNGNEVPIPSVDALALRIELGAIHENTELYDAQADQWGPAHTHEIFHTLVRAAADGERGFVAPPPPVPSAPSAAPEPTPPPEPVAPEKPAAEARPAPPEKKPDGDAIAGLTLADPMPASEPEDGGGGPAPAELGADDIAAEPAGDGFDFGDLSEGFTLEDPGAAGAGDAAMDFSTPDGGFGEAGGRSGGGEGGFGGALEQEIQFSPPGFGDLGGSGGLDLEQPMSDFTAEDPPSWMEAPDAADGEDVMDFSSASAEPPAPAEGVEPAGRTARKPKDRPSKPKFRRQRSMVGPIVIVVLLAAVGVGGYAAWPAVNAMWVARTTPPPPEAGLPPIPGGREQLFRAAGAEAFATAFRDARSAVGTVPSPPEEWLAGVYLANASQYEGVEVFWSGVQDQLDAIRDVGSDALLASFEASVASAGVPAEEREALLDRAEQGLRAGAGARRQLYDQVESLVDAALRLHDFLVANEENIEYTPAASVTSDPVLEARPATPQIRAAMEDRIDEVTDGLAGIDYLDRVTADGLWAAVLRRVQDVGIR